MASCDILDMVQIPLLAGRGYEVARDRVNPQAPQGEEPPLQNLIVNRSTTRALGFASPAAAVGQVRSLRYE